MKKYDYREAMIKDIKRYIKDNPFDDQLRDEEISEYLYDTLWIEDCVTGNGCYYYTSEERCREYVASNLDLYFEAAREFDDFPTGATAWTSRNPGQHMDATIRCYLLGECIEQALKELYTEDG